MKKLTEDHFKLLRSQYPVLSIEELVQVLGGDSEGANVNPNPNVSWDCLFNCMNFIDRSRTVAEYVALYTSSTGSNPSLSGGVPPGSVAGALSVAGFSATAGNTLGLGGRDIKCIVVYANPDGTGHAVIANSPTPENLLLPKKDKSGNVMKDKQGNEILEMQNVVVCFDPTKDGPAMVPTSDIVTIYQVQVPRKTEGGSGSGSGSKSENSSSSSN